MKKLAIGFLLFGATINVHAQTSAGHILLSGDIGYYTNTQESYSISNSFKQTYHQLVISPSIGYFLRENVAIGLTGSVERNRDESESYSPASYTGSRTSYSQSIGPFVRYYHMVSEQFGLYGQFTAGYQHGSSHISNNDPASTPTQSKYNGGFGNLTPGLVFFPTEKLGLQLTIGNIGYGASKGTQKQNGSTQVATFKTQGYSARFGLQNLSIGASFHVGG